jgi:TolB-like protein/tRNA A-37 threonylcarbamoyl transferase component Bud32
MAPSKQDAEGPPLPDNWAAIVPMLDQVLDAPVQDRRRLIDSLCAGDPGRAAELSRLVLECERTMPLLERPAIERFDRLGGDEPLLKLPPILGGRYRIDRELGRGGMARVFLAQDLKHIRAVAVKVIRPELAESLGRDRFLREIGIAARLRHPNIMPLYDSGDSDGVLWFVMPYEEGLSLKTRLGNGTPLPITDAVSILRDVARALAYAHAQGVVHRDVKPDNVMLSGGAAVVADFGIAKAISAAQTTGAGDSITQTGVVIGTPAYMAPEQAIGDPGADHRADIYAFGCLAYELFVGNPPFAGLSNHHVVAAHLGTAAKSISDTRVDIPEPIVRLVANCLEKDPGSRPQSAQALVETLESGATPSSARRARGRSRVRIAAAIAGIAAIGVIAFLVARGTLRLSTGASGPVTIAVLPLTSLGGDSLQPFVAEGLSDEIATSLVRYPWVRVKSRRGVGNYRGQREIDIEAIGKALGARYLVTGSFRDIGGRTTVQAQLLNASDGAVLWADQFTPSGELAVVRDAIAKAISDTLRTIAGGAARNQVGNARARRAGNPAAYQTYLVAQRKFASRGQSIVTSIELFREAISLDSSLADAYAGLSLALALSPAFQSVPAATVEAEATAMARKALQLDPDLGSAHTALALVLQHGYHWREAEAEFLQAVAADPHDVEARLQYGRHLLARGRLADGTTQFRAAVEDDPQSAIVAANYAAAWLTVGQVDSAIFQSRRALRIDSTALPAIGIGSSALAIAGRREEALELIKRNPPFQPNTLYLLGLSGDTARVRQALNAMAALRPRPGTFETATAFAMIGLGNDEAALDALDRASDQGEIWPTWSITRYKVNQRFTQSRRFQNLLARVGLGAN